MGEHRDESDWSQTATFLRKPFILLIAPVDGLEGLLGGRSLFHELLRGFSAREAGWRSSVGVIGEAGRVTMLPVGEVDAKVEERKSVLPCSWRARRSRDASSGGVTDRRPASMARASARRCFSSSAEPGAAAEGRRLPSFLRLKTETSFSGASPIHALRSPSSAA